MTKKTIVIERAFKAPIADVWDLWTTKKGIEAWWGPDGFAVEVLALDLRAGGALHYAMFATGAEQIEFMKRSGMPVRNEIRATVREVVPQKRLVLTNMVDFVPGVPPYPNDTHLELTQAGADVKLKLTIEAMHDEVWTQRAVMGWESELGKLAKLIPAA